MTVKFGSDIDIDLASRDELLKLLDVIPASIMRNNELIKHNTGVYATAIPTDPLTGQASIDHKVAEERGYAKLDLLNVAVYKDVRDEAHLIELMLEPDWSMLDDPAKVEKLIHINAHYDTLHRMPHPVNSIPRMAMFLALIRPAKRHLLGKPWAEVAKTIWERPADNSYYYKKAHAISYAHLVVVHMNLLGEK